MGLRIRGRESELSLLSCAARNLLTLVVPFALAGGILSLSAKTTFRSAELWSAALAILLFFPLSIIFNGGQSLVDIVLGLSVLPKKSRKDQFPAAATVRSVGLLLLTASLAGVICGFMPSLSQAAMNPRRETPNPPVDEFHISTQEERRIADGVWAHLQTRVPVPEGMLQDVKVYSAFGNLPISGGSDALIYESPCGSSYRSGHTYRVVRLQFDYRTPAFLADDMLTSLLAGRINYTGRPSFLVAEVAVREHFGVFLMEMPQVYIFCLGGSDGIPQDSLVETSRSMRVQSSINEIAWLLLGELDKYSSVEHLPIFP